MMEGSNYSSRTMTISKNPQESRPRDDDFARLVLKVGNLRLGEDHHETAAKPSLSADANSYVPFSGYPRADVDDTLLLSNKSGYGQGYNMGDGSSVWCRGESSSSNMHNNGADSSYLGSTGFGVGSSSIAAQSGLNSINNYPSSIPNYQNQFISNQYNPSFMPSTGLDYGYQYNPTDGPQSIINCLEHAFESKDFVEIDRILSTLQKYIFELMTNEKLSYVFQKFLDMCDSERLESVVQDLVSYQEEFINAAFCRHGATSINKLLRKLKTLTRHTIIVTEILSTYFLATMTHHSAREVILQCFNLFGFPANEVLYGKAIIHFPVLAINQVGCRSLNECIDTITGRQRQVLLNHISYTSDYLSNDPFGNYVVQHVLGLNNNVITTQIVDCLKGQFVELSKKKGGSHVVEKCMEYSDYGLVSVVMEIIDSSATLELAQHQFGNYIIQRALEKTKIRRFIGHYLSLKVSLQPDWAVLNKSVAGKNVLNCLRKLEHESRGSVL